MSVIFSNEALTQFQELTRALYDRGYFDYKENAIEYTDSIIDNIVGYISVKRKRISPKNLIRHGSHYITVNPTRRTTWYVFLMNWKEFTG